MSPQSNNSLDVTLGRKDCHIGTSQPVCKFNQTGFCKFGENCKNMHVNKLCNTLNCNKHICKNRHPRQCKYFRITEKCRFNDVCAFTHKRSGTNIKVEELEIEVIQLNLTTFSIGITTDCNTVWVVAHCSDDLAAAHYRLAHAVPTEPNHIFFWNYNTYMLWVVVRCSDDIAVMHYRLLHAVPMVGLWPTTNLTTFSIGIKTN